MKNSLIIFCLFLAILIAAKINISIVGTNQKQLVNTPTKNKIKNNDVIASIELPSLIVSSTKVINHSKKIKRMKNQRVNVDAEISTIDTAQKISSMLKTSKKIRVLSRAICNISNEYDTLNKAGLIAKSEYDVAMGRISVLRTRLSILKKNTEIMAESIGITGFDHISKSEEDSGVVVFKTNNKICIINLQKKTVSFDSKDTKLTLHEMGVENNQDMVAEYFK